MLLYRLIIIAVAGISLASCNMVQTLSQSKQYENKAIENKIASINQGHLTRSYQKCVEDGKEIETVFIPEKSRGTICVSSQVGCVLACSFCSWCFWCFKRRKNRRERGCLRFGIQT